MILRRLNEKKKVAEEALFFVKNGITLGLGEHYDVRIFLKLLVQKIKKEKLNVRIVVISNIMKKLVSRYRLDVEMFKKGMKVDLVVNGVDNIDKHFNVTRGLNFAFVQEKYFEYNAKRVLLIVDSGKFVNDVLDDWIYVKWEYMHKINFIDKIIRVKGDYYKIKINKYEIQKIKHLESELEAIGGSGLFSKFKEVVIIGYDNNLKKAFIRPREKLLQVAVDFSDKNKALKLIESIEEYVDIIEVGNSLIKSEGYGFVKKLKNYKKLISIDARVINKEELNLAIREGGDIVSVLGGSSNKDTQEIIREAKKNNKKVLIDLIDVKVELRLKRLVEILRLNEKPDIICVNSENVYNLRGLIKLCRINRIMVALSGKITKNKMKDLMSYDPDIFLIEEVITKSNNPRKIAKEMSDFLEKGKMY